MVDARDGFAGAVGRFADGLAGKFALRLNAQPEDPLKSAVGDLLTALGRLTSREVDYRPEVRVEDVGRPDLGITVGGLLTGYIELKAPGLGARPENFAADSANGRQWRRFGALPNLIYTDGEEWSLYREGKLKAHVRITGDLRAGGASALEADALPQLEQLLVDFLAWQPITPKNPRELAEFIAPYARILRNEVERAVDAPDSPLRSLAEHWRDILFPEADDAQFADAYAQTLTYALLLAQFEGAEGLRQQHALLADALTLLDSPKARAELQLPIDLIERAIAAVDPQALGRADEQDPWLYFYEQFLAAYDKKLRKSRGVYFTPIEVVRCQVRLAAELLRTRFGKPRAFAEEEVTVLDPAVGSGAYPLAVIEHAEQATREYSGAGMVAGRLRSLAERLYAFELLVGPYAVAHLRIAQRLRAAGVENQPPRVYLTDTLASPHQQGDTPPILQQLLPSIPREWEQAQQVKGETPILVCLGNPPYDRQQIDAASQSEQDEQSDKTEKRKGGWVRYGEDEEKGATRPILNDFLDPLKQAGRGRDAPSLYNDYVYFWRWALWKLLGSSQNGGIVTFITASSYLRGPGFLGMRRVMREVFDELWIIDLEGDSRGARKTENVFDIQSPVAITIGVRSDAPDSERPARVWKVRLAGSRTAKLAKLDEIESFGNIEWEECESAWDAPYLAVGTGGYFEWPCITDVFPWQHSGVKVTRTWPIGMTQAQLAERWHNLLARSEDDQRNAFRETGTRRIDQRYENLYDDSVRDMAIAELKPDSAPPRIVQYAFRALGRAWILADARIGDRMRPPLWRTYGPQQVFLTSLLTDVLGRGPAAVAAAAMPDLHHFSGRGGKDVIPLWRDAEATEPNVTGGLLSALEAALDYAVSAPDFFAYAYAVLAQPAYVERFWNQLEQPPPRLPITKDGELFRRAAAHGARLLYLHTYGERFGTPEDDGTIAPGEARCTVAVPHDEYPDDFRYDEQTWTLHIGKGQFAPVAPAVWSYSVSGLQVVKSWLDYRKRKPSGKKSSPLDEIRPERWEFGDELLELLWVLERTVALEPAGEALLEEILESELFSASELPQPQPHERKPPSARGGMALGGG